jgi:hypothetical protein
MTKGYTSALARQSWTDDRLDDRFDHLEAEMDQRFKRVEAEMKAAFRSEIAESSAELRREIREGNAELRSEIATLSAQFVALNQTLIRVAFSFAVAVVAGVLFHLL